MSDALTKDNVRGVEVGDPGTLKFTGRNFFWLEGLGALGGVQIGGITAFSSKFGRSLQLLLATLFTDCLSGLGGCSCCWTSEFVLPGAHTPVDVKSTSYREKIKQKQQWNQLLFQSYNNRFHESILHFLDRSLRTQQNGKCSIKNHYPLSHRVNAHRKLLLHSMHGIQSNYN